MNMYKLMVLGTATVADSGTEKAFTAEWNGPTIPSAALIAENTGNATPQRVSITDVDVALTMRSLKGITMPSPKLSEVFSDTPLGGAINVGAIKKGDDVSCTLSLPAAAASGNGVCTVYLLVPNRPTNSRR